MLYHGKPVESYLLRELKALAKKETDPNYPKESVIGSRRTKQAQDLINGWLGGTTPTQPKPQPSTGTLYRGRSVDTYLLRDLKKLAANETGSFPKEAVVACRTKKCAFDIVNKWLASNIDAPKISPKPPAPKPEPPRPVRPAAPRPEPPRTVRPAVPRPEPPLPVRPAEPPRPVRPERPRPERPPTSRRSKYGKPLNVPKPVHRPRGRTPKVKPIILKDAKVRAKDNVIQDINSGNPYVDYWIAKTYVDLGVDIDEMVSLWQRIVLEVKGLNIKRPGTINAMVDALTQVDRYITDRFGGSGSAWFSKKPKRYHKNGNFNFFANLLVDSDGACNCVCGTSLIYSISYDLGWTKDAYKKPIVCIMRRPGHTVVGIRMNVCRPKDFNEYIVYGDRTKSKMRAKISYGFVEVSPLYRITRSFRNEHKATDAAHVTNTPMRYVPNSTVNAYGSLLMGYAKVLSGEKDDRFHEKLAIAIDSSRESIGEPESMARRGKFTCEMVNYYALVSIAAIVRKDMKYVSMFTAYEHILQERFDMVGRK